jgi:hypothetical protein
VYEFGVLLRRHFVAVLGVLVLAIGVVHMFKTTPTTYMDGATVVFNPPVSGPNPNPYESSGGSIITAGGVISAFMSGPQGQRLVQAAGGTMPYDVKLINSYNQDYPDYSSPEVAVTVTGTDLAGVVRTYAAVIKVLNEQVVSRQAASGAPRRDRITTKLVGNPGPLALEGSSKRALGGLLLLTAIAVFAVMIFFERHPVRLRRRGRSRPGARRAGYPVVADRGASQV